MQLNIKMIVLFTLLAFLRLFTFLEGANVGQSSFNT